jgi:hypothetical protein
MLRGIIFFKDIKILPHAIKYKSGPAGVYIKD